MCGMSGSIVVNGYFTSLVWVTVANTERFFSTDNAYNSTDRLLILFDTRLEYVFNL